MGFNLFVISFINIKQRLWYIKHNDMKWVRTNQHFKMQNILCPYQCKKKPRRTDYNMGPNLDRSIHLQKYINVHKETYLSRCHSNLYLDTRLYIPLVVCNIPNAARFNKFANMFPCIYANMQICIPQEKGKTYL